jgi:hypothetical protein
VLTGTRLVLGTGTVSVGLLIVPELSVFVSELSPRLIAEPQFLRPNWRITTRQYRRAFHPGQQAAAGRPSLTPR